MDREKIEKNDICKIKDVDNDLKEYVNVGDLFIVVCVEDNNQGYNHWGIHKNDEFGFKENQLELLAKSKENDYKKELFKMICQTFYKEAFECIKFFTDLGYDINKSIKKCHYYDIKEDSFFYNQLLKWFERYIPNNDFKKWKLSENKYDYDYVIGLPEILVDFIKKEFDFNRYQTIHWEVVWNRALEEYNEGYFFELEDLKK